MFVYFNVYFYKHMTVLDLLAAEQAQGYAALVSKARPRWVIALRRVLDEAGVSQKAAAERAGVDDQSISNIMRRKTIPGADTLVKIAEGLGVDPVEMLATEEQSRRLRAAPSLSTVDALRAQLDAIQQQVNQLAVGKEAPAASGPSFQKPRTGPPDRRTTPGTWKSERRTGPPERRGQKVAS